MHYLWRNGERVVLALYSIGLAIAAVSSFSYLAGVPAPCSIGDCGTVAYHSSAFIVGIPVALIGVGYYCLQVLLLLIASIWPNPRILFLSCSIAVCGVLVSGYLIYCLVFVIGVSCGRCLASSIIASVSLIATYELLRHERPQLERLDRIVSIVIGVVLLGGCALAVSAAWKTYSQYRVQQLVSLKLSFNNVTVDDVLDGRTWGVTGAPTRVVAFVDLYCSACHYQLRNLIRRIDAGEKFELIVRLRPNLKNEESIYASVCAERIDSMAKYISFVETIGESMPGSKQEVERIFVSVTAESELLSEESAIRRIDRNWRVSRRVGINMTPSFIIVGRAGRMTGRSVVPYPVDSEQ